MAKTRSDRRTVPTRGIALFVLLLPAVAAGGISPQGISPQGISPQGISPQGISPQGISPQGISPQGISPQGISPQGISPQGVALLGTDLVAADLKGVDIGSVEIHGTTSDSGPVAFELTAGPTMSTGSGSYISVGGGSAVGHYGVAHLVDPAGNPAGDLDIYIAAEQADPVPNLLHRASSQDNDDVTLYEVFFFHKWSGQWASLCPFHDATGGNTAMALAEDPSNPSQFVLACTATGVAAKCARIWGFRPWRTDTTWFFDDTIEDWVEKELPFKPFYDSCKLAARAGYCQDRQSFTKNGTLVDLFDTRQFIWPNSIQNPWNANDPDSLWMLAQEYFVSFDPLASDPSLKASALQRTRWRDLSPENACASFASIDRLERDHFEDGRWANPLTNTPRVEVFSPNYCSHHEDVPGQALAWDCSPCTTAVCRHMPQCCSQDPSLPQPVWDNSCVNERQTVCQDVEGGGGPLWPTGRSWPADLTDTPAPQKYLLSPGGAVEGVTGVSAGATSATITGWSCDPEWPGMAVPIAVYGGAPGDKGGTLLGQAYADLALTTPLAYEVSAACDGPGRSTALHGFSFALPPGTSGDVYVYALDTATSDGPAAPPALLRNGIVRVPTCAHGEHVAGDALDASCSACAAAVCAKSGLAACCTTAWDDSCAAAAESCAPADASAAADVRAFAEVTTGWLEAPSSGTYVFSAGVQPSRVFVNGQKLVDWWDGPGPTSGSLVLQGGATYSLRWDRFQASTPVDGTVPGLTWQPPGAVGQTAIPATALYKVAPAAGTGLLARYYQSLGYVGVPVTRVDPGVDSTATAMPPAGVLPPTWSATWDGEVVPLYTDTYNFTVVAAGDADLQVGGSSILPPVPAGPPLAPSCPHDICALGAKLTASTTTEAACDPCVDQICAQDPFCCDGGYLSYYSTEPEWDAKCVAEVSAVCGLTCNTPIPTPSTRQRVSKPVALQAGVHYPIHLAVETSTSDATAQLVWSSPLQPRQVVPATSLIPPGPPGNRGAGLNVMSFATKSGGTKPDLDTPLAAGSTPDLTLAPPVGPNGLPVVPVLAAPDDPVAGVPAPPVLVSPRYGQQVYGVGPTVTLSGIGGLLGGSILAHVEGTATDVVLPVTASGTFSGDVPLGAFGTYTLDLQQRNYPGATCASPPAAFCAASAVVKWQVTVAPAAPASPPAPIITSPRDPTASPNPADATFTVTGTATPGAVTVCDLGGGTTLTPTVSADGTGAIHGSITLSDGASDPTKGWHKLVFTRSGSCVQPIAGGSVPVFVSVGVRPPTVEFPRTGAQIDCTPNAPPDPGVVQAKGTIPYAEASFGRLRVFEETGHPAMRNVARDTGVSQTPNADGSFSFQASTFLGTGKHLLYFFQAPDPPANATADEIAAHFRAFASLADTPKSRIQIDVPPPRLELPPNKLGALFSTGPLRLGDGNCNPANTANGPDCALPEADVVVRVDGRTWTTRADDNGNWDLPFELTPGWHHLRLSQVVDSRAGGGWQEGCPSGDTPVGVSTGNGGLPTLTLPGLVAVPATGPSGAVVSYAVSATTASGQPATIGCAPPSGSTFPLGSTPVLCTAIDPDTGAVGVDMFDVAVVDGPPVVTVPGDITAEAQSALGALVSWDASATDVVSGPLPVDCTPSSPALFSLDETTPVTCQATDGAGNTTSATFDVTVKDTTPPTLCPLPDLRVLASGPGGGVVSFATCASDLVDGSDPVSCDHPSGSFFPVGKTRVTCAATDRHLNTSAPSTFTVDVGDSTPPVLKLPGTITVAATSRAGARVAYAVTATDDTDPHPTVSCAPPSGGVFPLGDTTVGCTATDASGNKAMGAFHVRVLVSFGGFLPPVNNNGSSVFPRPVPVLVRFALADQSLNVFDLPAKLYVAKVDAAGHVGAEQPAAGLPPAVGNNFVFVGLPFLLVREYDLLMDDHAMSAGVWQLRVDLGDGVAHAVRITLR
ncbi:MAG TPA: HYR domain-containing protein [Polyangia bacterium]|nr:HYR domain-containing protein [Polyangia bacterium]